METEKATERNGQQYDEQDYYHRRSSLFGHNSVGPVVTPGSEEFRRNKKKIITGAILSVVFIAAIIALVLFLK